jgi:hypothetical protein
MFSVVAIMHIGFAKANSGESAFLLRQEPTNIYSPLDQLGIHTNKAVLGNPPYFIRQDDLKSPGDYYRYPMGADALILSKTQKEQIDTNLVATIKDNYFSSDILDSLKGFKYSFTPGSPNREEYHICYIQGDTVYVISGWLGKFLSFYRAIPDTVKYEFYKYMSHYRSLQNSKKFSFTGFQSEISKLALPDIKIPKELFNNSLKDSTLFFEYVDKEKMIRVRCYRIGEEAVAKSDLPYLTITAYTLIEITKFLDKEVMP